MMLPFALICHTCQIEEKIFKNQDIFLHIVQWQTWATSLGKGGCTKRKIITWNTGQDFYQIFLKILNICVHTHTHNLKQEW